MCIEHRHLGVEFGFDFRERDLALRLHLQVNGVVLRLLLLGLRLMCGDRRIGLRLRLRDQHFWVRRRHWRRWRRMQQLSGLRIDLGRVVEEFIPFL
jgi:hypothetical protein